MAARGEEVEEGGAQLVGGSRRGHGTNRTACSGSDRAFAVPSAVAARLELVAGSSVASTSRGRARASRSRLGGLRPSLTAAVTCHVQVDALPVTVVGDAVDQAAFGL